MLSRNGIRQPHTRNRSPEIALNASTARFARKSPAGTPNCGHDAMKPRCLVVLAHSIASRTEPPHSPPTPTPCTNRNTVRITAPQTPMPTYDSIGVWGAVILTVLRFVQGVGVGGEWCGSVLMSMEWSKSDSNRGFIASWPQFGVPAGLFLANLAVLVVSQMSGEQFSAWGWRVPFLLSLLLVAVGLYIRLGILETPVFSKLVAEQKIERTPILEVIKNQ